MLDTDVSTAESGILICCEQFYNLSTDLPQFLLNDSSLCCTDTSFRYHIGPSKKKNLLSTIDVNH